MRPSLPPRYNRAFYDNTEIVLLGQSACLVLTWKNDLPPTKNKKPRNRLICRAFVGGRYWDRTSDPCRVKAVLYR